MSHPIIEGPVKLLKIVTPGAYWIECDACEGSCRTPTSIKHKPHPNEYYYPQQGAKVFAQDQDGFFYRGTVCGRRVDPKSDYWKYVVQLTDTFQVKDFLQQDVYPTYGESSASCQSAHLVSLYHMLPRIPPTAYGKCLNINSAEIKAFENAVANWGKSVASMAHLCRGRVKFSFVQSKLINGSIYGEFSTSPPLVTQTGNECLYLSDYLYFERLGEKMTFRFEAVIGALMTNPLIDYNDVLATFDLFGTVSSKPKRALPHEKSPEPVDHDFTGFKVHTEDVTLHQSLCKQFYINIIYIGAPPKHDTVLRYVSPNGSVLLGTVLNLNVRYADKVGSWLQEKAKYPSFSPNSFSFLRSSKTNEYTEIYYADELFDKLPPNENPGILSDEPRTSLLSYNFDECCRNFQAAGGVFKEVLFPYPLSSAVEKFIVQHFDSLGVDSLHEWQKLCLPTFLCRKNLIVLGPKSSGKMTMATISALSWMSYVNPSKSDSVHPQLIIFFSDFNRADKAASLCAQLTDFRVIVSTSAVISEKQKGLAMNGCDVLITTPSNWAKLLSESVFDYSRLNHAIFDEFDLLHEFYTEDLVNIFKALDLSSCRRIQAVLVTSSWGAVIGDRRIQEKIEFPTVCIMDVILTCLYHKLTPTAVFVKRNDWVRHLKDILSIKNAAKRVLLCKDVNEGSSIIETISHIDGSILFVNEHLHKSTVLKIVNDWDRNNDKLLVCTDNCFKLLDSLKDVGVIISWMTSSRTTLSSRFMAFSHTIRSKKSLSWTSAYLFCDCEKLQELLLIRNISNNARFINGTLDEHLSIASIQAEQRKLTILCPSVFMFGKCNAVPTCPLRHVFLPHDDLEVLDSSQYLNVDILRVHNAFRYSVRVRGIVSNFDHRTTKNIHALVSKLEEIENGLEESWRKPCSPHTLEIGQMIGACIIRGGDPLLRRVEVKSTPADGSSDFYSLSIVDFEEDDVHLPLSQLFSLSEEVAKYPKDVTELFIAGLEPADFKSDWQYDTFNYVTTVMNQVIKESNFLAGKVEIVTANRWVLVDSFHCFKEHEPPQKTTVSVIDSEFCSLKELILESGFCVKNSAHLSSLSESLVKSTSLSNGPARPPLLLNTVGKYGCRTDLPPGRVPGVVSIYDDPGLFYVQLEGESNRLVDFEIALSSTLERYKRKLRLVAIYELCAVQYKGVWNRALIFDILADLQNPVGPVQILFVDHGDKLLDAQPHQLYCLPDDYVTSPFFAVQCELVGIQPFLGDNWHEKALAAFSSYIRSSDDKMENLIVQFCGTKNEDQLPYYLWKYLVVLWQPNDPGQSINHHLARRGLVNFDPKTKRMIEPSVNGWIRNRSQKEVRN